MQLDAATVIARLEMARQMKSIRRPTLAKTAGYSEGTLLRMVKFPETVKLSQVVDVAEALGVEITVQFRM